MSPGSARSSNLDRLLWGGLAVVLVAVAFVGVRALQSSKSTPLPVYGTVPAFSLTERSGRTVKSEELKGKVWLADFIFTRCRGTCPLMSKRLSDLQKTLQLKSEPDLRFVSFTVDPAADTEAVLTEYARLWGASQDRWLFLTGDRTALYDLIGKGFHLAVAERPVPGDTDPNDLITHSDRFVLIDRQLQIRGYYISNDDDAMQRLVRDVRTLQRPS